MLLGHLKWRAEWKPAELTEADAPTAIAAGSNRLLGTGASALSGCGWLCHSAAGPQLSPPWLSAEFQCTQNCAHVYTSQDMRGAR